MSINLVGREYVNTEATATTASVSLGSPTAIIIGAPNTDTSVRATIASSSLATLSASAQNEVRVFPNTAKLNVSETNLVRWSEQVEAWDSTGGGAVSSHDQTFVNTDIFFNPHGGALTVDEIKHYSAPKALIIEIRETISVLPNTNYHISIHGRLPSSPDFGTHTCVAAQASQYVAANFDMSNGAVTGTFGPISGVQTEAAGNGFYRVGFSVNTGSAQTMIVLYRVADGPNTSDVSFFGSDIHSMWWSGMQVTRGTTWKDYVKTDVDVKAFNVAVVGTGVTQETNVTVSRATLSLTGNNPFASGGSPIANYPFVTAGFAIGNGLYRRTIEPSKTNFASKNFAIHQMISFNNEPSRRTRYLEWQGMFDINPYQVHIPHIDFHGIEFDPPGSNGATNGWFDHLVYSDNSNFSNWVAVDKLNRTQYPGGPYTSMQSFDSTLSFRWDAPEYVHTQVATRMWQDWSNFNDPRTYAEGGANLARDFKFGIMQDTLSQNASNVIQWFPEYEGTVTGVINDNEIEIGTWSTATQVSNSSDHFSGPLVGDYQQNSHDLQIIVMKANHSDAYSDKIIGHRTINGSTDRILIDGTANFTPSVGDLIWVKVRQFQTAPTDKTSSIWDLDLYHQRTVFNLETVSNLNRVLYGISTDIYSNQGSQNFNVKQQGGTTAANMPVTLWQNKWGGIHWEHADGRIGFAGDSAEIGYWTNNAGHQRNTQDYDPDEIPLAIAANRPLLKTNSQSANGYPCLWWNIEYVRKENWDNTGPGVTTRYAALDELDAAYVRFWSLMCWCMDNVAPQAEMGAHADPVMIDEELINAGLPVGKRDFWVNWDQTGNDGRGTYDWRPPDFGTHGYFFEFENCMIQINLRPPDTLGQWIPSYMEGGQEIDPERDRGILPYAGDGFKWKAFDRATYVNDNIGSQFYGKTPSDYDATYIMKDAGVNNGLDRSVFFDTGPLEAVIHMRAPTSGVNVNIDNVNPRNFYYKEKPIQLFGHQHFRINVDQATEKDMPAVMNVAGDLQKYMDALANRGMNHIRLWPYFSSDSANAAGQRAFPPVWQRPGPGLAGDGGARFDLTQLNQQYFDRVDEVLYEAYIRDIIVTVLIWDVYGFQGTRQPWNPLTNRSFTNNINGIEVDINNTGWALDGMYEGTIPAAIQNIQIAYERKLVDTINKYPNFIWEVNNEQGRLPFQTNVMDRIRAYELNNYAPDIHQIGLSAGGLLDNTNYSQTDVGKTAVMGTTADFIMPGTNKFGATWGDTDDSSGSGPPLQSDTTRPWIIDMDHIEPGARRPDHFWKCLTRGYGYNHFESNSTSDPVLSQPYSTLYWEDYMNDTVYGFNTIRRNIGTGQDWFNNKTKNQRNMTPTSNTSACSTTYCIADIGEEYIAFSPSDRLEASTPTFYGLVDSATYRVKWYDPTNGVDSPGVASFTATGTQQTLTAPFALGTYGAAIHVWRVS